MKFSFNCDFAGLKQDLQTFASVQILWHILDTPVFTEANKMQKGKLGISSQLNCWTCIDTELTAHGILFFLS